MSRAARATATVTAQAVERAASAFAHAPRIELEVDEPTLTFEFAPYQPVGMSKSPMRRPPSTIKDAIVRWLDEQI